MASASPARLRRPTQREELRCPLSSSPCPTGAPGRTRAPAWPWATSTLELPIAVYVAPGIVPRWLGDGEAVSVSGAPTVFGSPFGYRLVHDAAVRTVEIEITEPPPAHVPFVFPCRLGAGVRSATADGRALPVGGRDVTLPAGTRRATVTYA